MKHYVVSVIRERSPKISQDSFVAELQLHFLAESHEEAIERALQDPFHCKAWNWLEETIQQDAWEIASVNTQKAPLPTDFIWVFSCEDADNDDDVIYSGMGFNGATQQREKAQIHIIDLHNVTDEDIALITGT